MLGPGPPIPRLGWAPVFCAGGTHTIGLRLEDRRNQSPTPANNDTFATILPANPHSEIRNLSPTPPYLPLLCKHEPGYPPRHGCGTGHRLLEGQSRRLPLPRRALSIPRLLRRLRRLRRLTPQRGNRPGDLPHRLAQAPRLARPGQVQKLALRHHPEPHPKRHPPASPDDDRLRRDPG